MKVQPLAAQLALLLVRPGSGYRRQLAAAGRAFESVGGEGARQFGEFVRRVSDLADLQFVSAPHPTIDGVDTFRLTPGEAGTTLANVIAGFKWNVQGTLVLGGHVAFPLVRHGLTAPVTPTFALEYSF